MKKKLAIVSTIVVVALVCVFAFAACTPSLDSLKEKYSEEGYLATGLSVGAIIDKLLEDAEDVEVDESTVEYGFFATKLTDTIVVVAFNDKDVLSEVKTALDDAGVTYKTKGSAIAVGSEGALKLF